MAKHRVKGHRRRDGTYVKPHQRSRAGGAGRRSTGASAAAAAIAKARASNKARIAAETPFYRAEDALEEALKAREELFGSRLISGHHKDVQQGERNIVAAREARDAAKIPWKEAVAVAARDARDASEVTGKAAVTARVDRDSAKVAWKEARRTTRRGSPARQIAKQAFVRARAEAKARLREADAVWTDTLNAAAVERGANGLPPWPNPFEGQGFGMWKGTGGPYR